MYNLTGNKSFHLTIKGSKFIALYYNLSEFSDIADNLNTLRQEYKDATHICYGAIFNEITYVEDDGEPSSTAGASIVNCLKRENLAQIVIFVIRYFGHAKLGIPGLIDAYSSSASNLIANSSKKEIKLYHIYRLQLSHISQLNVTIHLLEHNNAEILEKEFGDSISLLVALIDPECLKKLSFDITSSYIKDTYR
jgi:putative IMPACT (imprinted ancient) family translation regulator